MTITSAYVESLGSTLWPGAMTTLHQRGWRTSARTEAWEYLILPNVRHPRLLLPLTSRKAAAGALRRFSEQPTAMTRLRVETVAALVRCGLAQLVLPSRLRVESGTDDRRTIEAHLRHVLGDVVLGISVGKPRANRKPVVQVLNRNGGTIGFVKVGVDDLTRGLVVAERDALRVLDAARTRLATTRTPAVVHAGTWEGLEILVQTALPVWQRRAPSDPSRLRAAMREVASIEGLRRSTLAASSYWRRLLERVQVLHDASVTADLTEACALLRDMFGDCAFDFGAWHGDWTPWNMAFLRDGVLVWDWERFERDVPVGFDALHHALQEALVRRRLDPRYAASVCLDTAPDTLGGFVFDRRAARATALLYLVDIAARYSADGQEKAGARLGRLQDWLLPALRDQVSAMRWERDER
jgi:hypothetical protein